MPKIRNILHFLHFHPQDLLRSQCIFVSSMSSLSSSAADDRSAFYGGIGSAMNEMMLLLLLRQVYFYHIYNMWLR